MKTNSQRAVESQQRRKAAGLCTCCGEPRFETSKNFCLHHLKVARKRARNAAREKAGIPLKRKLGKQGRKRLEDL